MIGKKFITEMKNTLTLTDFATVRNLYQPIVGLEATALYQVLYDYNEINKIRRTYFSFADLQNTLKLSFDEINKARMILEAVGLLRTFEKADNKTFIILINKPLTATAFRSNSLLYKQYVAKVGEELFERFEFSNREFVNEKEEYVETTVKFQDMFDIDFVNKGSTIEVELPTAANKDDAIRGLTTMQFVKFLTNKKISPALLKVVQDLQKIGFSTKSINLLTSYSFDVNGKVVAKHVQAIATDLFAKHVVSSDEVELELAHALEARAPKVADFAKPENSTAGQELEWDDIFNALGDL